MANSWILVADGAHARVFERIDDENALHEIACFANPDGRASGRSLSRGRPPRVQESSAETRHAIEPHTTLRDKSAERFARELCDVLERGRKEQRYERLVLVVPPRFLGTLHAILGKPLRDSVVGEYRRNLTTLPADEIASRLPRRFFTPPLRRAVVPPRI